MAALRPDLPRDRVPPLRPTRADRRVVAPVARAARHQRRRRTRVGGGRLVIADAYPIPYPLAHWLVPLLFVAWMAFAFARFPGALRRCSPAAGPRLRTADRLADVRGDRPAGAREQCRRLRGLGLARPRVRRRCEPARSARAVDLRDGAGRGVRRVADGLAGTWRRRGRRMALRLVPGLRRRAQQPAHLQELRLGGPADAAGDRRGPQARWTGPHRPRHDGGARSRLRGRAAGTGGVHRPARLLRRLSRHGRVLGDARGWRGTRRLPRADDSVRGP